jgi:predicted Rossmann fold nucleotide-binding protein DprA/Smf involved in DNA uptake
MSDIRYWVGLSLVPEVGPLISRKLLSEMGSPENIFRAGLKDLQAVKGLTRQQGAKMVLGASDIIEELAPVLRGFIKARGRQSLPELSEEERAICRFLTKEPMHIDLLSREGGLPAHKILDLLLALELKDIVRQSGGKRFYLS